MEALWHSLEDNITCRILVPCSSITSFLMLFFVHAKVVFLFSKMLCVHCRDKHWDQPTLGTSQRETGLARPQKPGFGARACGDQNLIQLPPAKFIPGYDNTAYFYHLSVHCMTSSFKWPVSSYKCRDKFKCGLTFSPKTLVCQGLRALLSHAEPRSKTHLRKHICLLSWHM